jgi:hypothetical protein
VESDSDLPPKSRLSYRSIARLPAQSLISLVLPSGRVERKLGRPVNFTHETPIHLIASGNRSDTEIFTPVPAFAEAALTRFLNRFVYIERYDICGFEENRSTYKDLLFWILRYPDTSVVADYSRGKRRLKKKDSTANLDEAMAFSIIAFHLHDTPRPSDMDGNEITFGTGPIGNASYTRTDCDLARSRPPPEELRVGVCRLLPCRRRATIRRKQQREYPPSFAGGAPPVLSGLHDHEGHAAPASRRVTHHG